MVDTFSDVGSFELANGFMDRVYRKEWGGHREQYQYAANLTENNQVMFVDADEEVPSELVDEIREELDQNRGEWDGNICYRRTFNLGRWIKCGGWHPEYEIRLYHRDRGKWVGDLHANLSVEGRVKHLNQYYLHYTYRDISDQIQTIDNYSRTAAEDVMHCGEKPSLFKLLLRLPFRFLKEYLFKAGFLNELPGLIIAVSTVFYVFIKYAKLW